MLEDNSGNLWLSTNYGLSKFDPDQENFKNYYVQDGLQGNQFNRWAFSKLTTGELVFGGVNGFNLFKPEQIVDNSFAPPVYITQFRIFNEKVSIGEESVLKENIIVADGLKLEYQQNVISFQFSALNFQQPEQNQYKYKLEGFSDDWINLRNERVASFTNLSPGDYNLKVIASNNDGLWNEEGASFSIEVLPPWWATWWFRTIMVLVVMAAIYLFYRWRTYRMRQTQRELNNKIALATKEIEERNERLAEAQEKMTDIMNDVRHDLGKASEDLLAATNSEAASIEEISASINNMSSEVSQNAKGAFKILSGSQNIAKDAENTVSTMSDTEKAISQIHQEIQFITEFARKTNLIALNASIEAARAGEYGRSFAVVAGEVKKLADQSHEASNRIMKFSVNGLRLSENANETIQNLHQEIQDIVALINQISESSQDQAVQAENINAGIQQIEDYVTKTAALAEKLDKAINALSVEK
jgi:methyl-accepting chemotaxis protein